MPCESAGILILLALLLPFSQAQAEGKYVHFAKVTLGRVKKQLAEAQSAFTAQINRAIVCIHSAAKRFNV